MINGDRVKLAREIKGLTQAELADLIKVSQPAIAQLERFPSGGGFQPSAALIEAVAFQLRFPISFFKKKDAPEFPMGSLLYRKRSSLRSAERNRLRQYARLAYEMYRELSMSLTLPKLSLPSVLGESPESAAQLARASLGISPDRPVKNLVNLLERNGVVIFAVPFEIEDHDSFSLWASDPLPAVPVIVVSIGKPGDRQRFTLSHELGHLCLHRAFNSSVPILEDQANRFAAEFLMPAEAIRNEIKTPVTLGSLASLKPKWGVSIQALIRRSRDLEIISDRRYTYLFQQLTKLGYRKREPEQLDITPEKPRAFRKMVEVAFGVPFDPSKVAESLGVSVSFLTDFLDSQAEMKDLSQTGEPIKYATGIEALNVPLRDNLIQFKSSRKSPRR